MPWNRMMSDWEREKFTLKVATLAAETLARGGEIRRALSPFFHQALSQHPDEEDRLLQLWDRLTSRPAL